MSGEDPAKRAFDLLASGRIQEAAPAAEQAGRLLLAERKPLEATAALTTAARLFAHLGKHKHAATVLALAEAPAAEVGRTVDVLRARAELASRAGDTAGAAAALRRAAATSGPTERAGDLVRLAQLAVAKGDVRGAADLLAQAAAAELAAGDPDVAAHDHIERAICLYMAGDREAATASLAEAERTAPDNKSVRARSLGQQAVMALAEDRIADAERLALASRDAAVKATNPIVYLQAASLVAGACLRGGREVEAYDAVTRARASLKDLLGPEGEELARPFYDAFCAALGDRREEVRDRWIAMRQAAAGNGPVT